MKKSLGAKTLVLPSPAWVIGVYDKQGRPNIMTVAWGGICCSVPPCVAISLRKATHTYGAVMERKFFTVNVPSEELAAKVDFVGMASGRDTDKFAAAGLTPVMGTLVNAPYIEEFPLVLECRVLHTIEIGLHTQFIGEILDVKADEAVLGADDLPSVEKLRPIAYATGVSNYYALGRCLGQAFAIGKEVRSE